MAGDDPLIVDDAHLLDTDSIELLVRFSADHPIVLGVHPGNDGAVHLLERFGHLPVIGPQPVDDDVIGALVTTWARPGVETNAVTRRSSGLPGVARALAIGGSLESAMIDSYRRLARLLSADERRWIAAAMVAPERLDRTELRPPPKRLAELDLVDLDNNSVRPALFGELVISETEPADLNSVRSGLADQVSDQIARARLLNDAGEHQAATEVASDALTGSQTADDRATLAGLAATDCGSGRFAAGLLVERERPAEAAELLERMCGCDDSETVELRCAISRQLDTPDRWSLIDSLAPTSPESVRQRSWGNCEITTDHANESLPDPVIADDLDAARFRWHQHIARTTVLASGPESATPALDSLADRGEVAPSWRQLATHVATMRQLHREGATREMADALIRNELPALPTSLLDAHRMIAFADIGDSASALALQTVHEPISPMDRALQAWARAESELAAGHPVAAARVADSATHVDLPPAWMAQVCRAWAVWDVGDSPPPLHTASESPLAALSGDEVTAIGLLHVTDPAAAGVFDDVAERWSGVHHRGELRCRWAAGESARQAGQTAAAIERLTLVEQACELGGYGPLLQRVRLSLRLAGVRRTGRRQAAAGPLSGREAEVIELVGKGMTSRDIAARIGVSSATVETQITSAMQKLNARTRLQAALAYRELST